MAKSAYSHKMRTGNFGEEENLVAKPIDQRTAVLPDGTRLRMTPEGQKTVNVLVEEGDIIRTSYGTGGRVVGVTEYTVYGLPVYTITFVDVEAKPFLDGHYARTALNWINECVAQDDRILMLFEANDDEVFIVQKKEKFRILKSVIAENQKKSTTLNLPFLFFGVCVWKCQMRR